jgi:hypothetical protein
MTTSESVLGLQSHSAGKSTILHNSCPLYIMFMPMALKLIVPARLISTSESVLPIQPKSSRV